jgi:hypothetical protein
MPVNAAERMKAMRARKAKSGIIDVRVHAHSEEHAAMIRTYAQGLRAADALDFSDHAETTQSGNSRSSGRS